MFDTDKKTLFLTRLEGLEPATFGLEDRNPKFVTIDKTTIYEKQPEPLGARLAIKQLIVTKQLENPQQNCSIDNQPNRPQKAQKEPKQHNGNVSKPP